jgi:hypothetical protein
MHEMQFLLARLFRHLSLTLSSGDWVRHPPENSPPSKEQQQKEPYGPLELPRPATSMGLAKYVSYFFVSICLKLTSFAMGMDGAGGGTGRSRRRASACRWRDSISSRSDPPSWGARKNRMRTVLKATPPHQMGTVRMDPRKQLDAPQFNQSTQGFRQRRWEWSIERSFA